VSPPLVFGLLLGAFVVGCTSLVTVVVGLARRGKWGPAALSLVPPLAVWFAYREGLRGRAVVLALALASYLAMRVAFG